MFPGLLHIQFDTGNPHENHHCPPSDAVQSLDYRGIKNKGVIIRKGRAQYAGAEQNAGDNLHHY
jgi:hypothetical protein